ncbi:MAG: GNAT family N-acetyltransferase, partial [Rhodobacteraceae bacterium]|nr:GNAT family N-acetyltransferase [Paracoccaceae bacterium]
TPKPGRLYIGKLAVDEAFRRQGLSRQLVALAEDRARALGLGLLELEVRIELTENHRMFEGMGFARSAETSHEGYDRITGITFTRPVA